MIPLDPSLLQNILDNPNDTQVRLIAADWWEEQGETERAEFARLQVRLEDLGIKRPILNPVGEILPGGIKVDELVKREQELTDRLKEDLIAGMPGKWVCANAFGPASVSVGKGEGYEGPPKVFHFRRGFIYSIACSAQDFVKHADTLMASSAQEVELTTNFVNNDLVQLDVRYRKAMGWRKRRDDEILVFATGIQSVLKLLWPRVEKWKLPSFYTLGEYPVGWQNTTFGTIWDEHVSKRMTGTIAKSLGIPKHIFQGVEP